MENVIFSHLAPEARLEAIKQCAKGTETMEFTRKLSEAEIDEESRRLSSLVQFLIDTETEKAQVVKEYTDTIKTTKAKMEDSSRVISKGAKDVRENVFKFINYEAQEVGFYDSLGNLIKVRHAQPEELQADMFGAGDVQKLEDHSGDAPEPEDVDFEEVNEE